MGPFLYVHFISLHVHVCTQTSLSIHQSYMRTHPFIAPTAQKVWLADSGLNRVILQSSTIKG